jgi:hypothetical protein
LNKHFENLLGGRYTEDFSRVAGEAAGVNFDKSVIAADGSDFGMRETVEFSSRIAAIRGDYLCPKLR